MQRTSCGALVAFSPPVRYTPPLPTPVRILIGWLAGEEPPGVNGARDEQARRNGVSSVHDEAAHDEGMEISDG